MPFYKQAGANVVEAINAVINKNYKLLKKTKEKNTYPVDGWYWFDTPELAKASGTFTFPEKWDTKVKTVEVKATKVVVAPPVSPVIETPVAPTVSPVIETPVAPPVSPVIETPVAPPVSQEPVI